MTSWSSRISKCQNQSETAFSEVKKYEEIENSRYRFHIGYELISQIILTHILLCRKLESLASRISPIFRRIFHQIR